MQNKFDELKKYLKKLNEQGICLAFSGGIDSTLLLFLCKNLNFEAVTFKSVFQTNEEVNSTIELCKKYDVKQTIKEFYPLENSILINNPKDRCYHCKKILFEKLKKYSGNRAVIDGTNFDDLSVYRPGRKALKELGVVSPLAEFKITKSEIRDYAKELGIEIYDKPSMPCLATRFPYGESLSAKKLKIVNDGEIILRQFGYENCRLRLYRDVARVEVPCDNFDDFIKNRDKVVENLKGLGIKYITLDLEGLRCGSMDL